jgi:uncharacterized protein (TIGR02145 family)
MTKKILVPVLFLICTIGIAQQRSTFIDPRDGQVYRTVEIKNDIWMAQNLNYETKDSIYFREIKALFPKWSPTLFCQFDNYCYNDSISNCEQYGRFYTWESAMNACPVGWHLPNKAEVDTLLTALREPSKRKIPSDKLKKIPYDKLKSEGSSGFNALFGGYGALLILSKEPYFKDKGRYCNLWTSVRWPLKKYPLRAGYLGFILFPNHRILSKFYETGLNSHELFNVRCVKNK